MSTYKDKYIKYKKKYLTLVGGKRKKRKSKKVSKKKSKKSKKKILKKI